MRTIWWSWRGRVGRTAVHVTTAALVAGATACTGGQAVLVEQTEARRVTSALHVNFVKGNEATERAVLADTDEASTAAANEARVSMAAAAESFHQLQPLLTSLGYGPELKNAEAFERRFAELQTLDADILPLAVENTNLKAQRLSFGEGQGAADAFAQAMRDAATGTGVQQASVTTESSIAAVLRIQVLQARHIAEADEAAMTRLEAQMHEAEGVALRGIATLRRFRSAKSEALDAADAALERFLSVNQEIVDLSRRNTNVRSLALTLGRRRVVAAECEDQLRALDAALNAHGTRATR